MVITCFNLAGGYAMAVTVISQPSESALNLNLTSNSTRDVLKKQVYDLLAVQAGKCEEEEDDWAQPELKFHNKVACSSFTPDFNLLNKHFLVHYSKAIKAKHPAASLLYHNLRL